MDIFSETNIALRKTTYQSDIGWGGSPDKAVDGDRESNYGLGSCMHTSGTSHGWLAVDLEQYYTVTSVTITNRGDCCGQYVWFSILSE